MGLSAADFLCRFGDADAFTLRRGSQYIIAYREDGHPARRNFTLAHELAHRLLHHTGASPEEEREADMFASHLLCPRPAIARLARRFQPLYAEQVAAVCYVSLSCARALSAAPPVDIEETLYRQVDAQLAAYVDCVTPTTAQNHLHPLLWRAE
ncbi:MAG: ImmA/IrrE family metallo-endopeptidase [Clostridia bacterium]|nr:ImmA/IrrE family metallo-endopeptidase [Clostridia bacterium]